MTNKNSYLKDMANSYLDYDISIKLTQHLAYRMTPRGRVNNHGLWTLSLSKTYVTLHVIPRLFIWKYMYVHIYRLIFHIKIRFLCKICDEMETPGIIQRTYT